MNFLITGAAGFLGSALANRLAREGHLVRGLDDHEVEALADFAQTRNLLQQELLEIWEKTKKTIMFVTHSVDEAVFLANRLVVLTPRPGQVCEVIPIDLERPRDRTSVEFAQVRRKVLDLIAQPKCTLQ
jgi:NitT/TauT family transport system ATP-binding protein